MEAKLEYQVFDEKRKQKFMSIRDGVFELMKATVEKEDTTELEQKYPRAAAYLKAQKWSWDKEPKKAALGKQAMDRILDGDDPAVVLEEMESSWAAFLVAQEG